jgi:hypothetical protein
VSSEMISGPDLGGGYLHQLSRDTERDRTTFTYHAQIGGDDAGGPPLGPLDAFGFVHPPSSCQFGGPRCWHRRFLLPVAETPRVRQAYNRTRFVMETMLKQRFGGAPVGVKAALAELVRRIAPALAAESLPWYVGGSAAAWLLGADVVPRDVDLGTDRRGVDRIAAAVPEYLIEAVAPTDWPGAGIVRGARAFVGTFSEGARAEWAVPLDPAPTALGAEWSGDPARVRTVPVAWEGGTIAATRPEYALVRAAIHGATDRFPPLAGLVRRLGPDRALLDELLAAPGVPASVPATVRALVDG